MRLSDAVTKWITGTCLLGLAACGGGGSSNGTAPPANQPPVFSSATSVSVAENTSGTFYTVSASDPDGGAVTLSVVSGGDEGAFTIDLEARTIAFASPPDFEAPLDANLDNTYGLTLEARDAGGLTARLSLTVTVTDLTEGLALQRTGSGFSTPLFVIQLPGTEQLVVLEKGGLARLLNRQNGTIRSVPFLDVSGSISTDGERGLLGLTFSPDFATDRTFYVNVTNPAGDTEIRRYQTYTTSPGQADPTTEELVLTIPQEGNNHNGGWLDFGPDGLLYVAMGDGGGAGDPLERAQDPDFLLGKLLRIDVTSDDFPADPDRNYAIPAGNAYPGGAGGRPEIYALGLRNPFRCSFDAASGDLFIADVGQGVVEEIDRIGTNEPGVNFGWDNLEGTEIYEGPDDPSFRHPVAQYFHGSAANQGNSITGGYVYRGSIAAIRDHYVFADFVNSNVWSIPEADLVNGSTVAVTAGMRLNDQLVPDQGSLSNVSSFGEDADGNLYIVSYGSGDIFRFVSMP